MKKNSNSVVKKPRRKKTVEAWIVIGKNKNPVRVFGRYPFMLLVHPLEENSFIGECIPCTISYQLPNIQRNKKKL